MNKYGYTHTHNCQLFVYSQTKVSAWHIPEIQLYSKTVCNNRYVNKRHQTQKSASMLKRHQTSTDVFVHQDDFSLSVHDGYHICIFVVLRLWRTGWKMPVFCADDHQRHYKKIRDQNYKRLMRSQLPNYHEYSCYPVFHCTGSIMS